MGGFVRDTLAVAWKEGRELLAAEGRESGLVSLVLFVGLLGVFLPWQVGPAWLTAPWVLLFWVWVPIFLMTTVMADTFAGERERRTLGALLATRLSDRAILAGKVASAVLYVWCATLISIPLSLIAINLKSAGPEIFSYSPDQLVMVGGISFLASLLGAAIGVLVSLKAPTVRHAQQTFSLGVLTAFIAPVFVVQMLPGTASAELVQWLVLGDAAGVASVLASVIVVLNCLFLTAGWLMFRRGRLLLT